MYSRSLFFNRYATFIFLFIIVVFIGITIFSIHGYGFDTMVYIKAIHAAFSGHTLYHDLNYFTSFIYPPSALLILFPFGFIPSFIGGKLWFLLSLGAIILSMFLFFKAIRFPFSLNIFLALIIYTLFTFPFQQDIQMGQVNSFILLFSLLPLFFLSLKQHPFRNEIYAGLSVGVAASLKLLPFILIFYFLLRKKYIAAATTIFSFIFFNIAAFIVFRIQLHDFFQYLTWIPQILFPPTQLQVFERMDYQFEQSFSGLLYALFGLNATLRKIVIIVVSAVLLGIATYSFLRTKKQIQSIRDALFIALLLGIATFIPVTLVWEHHAILIYPLFWYLVGKVYKKQTQSLMVIGCVSLLNFLFNPYNFMYVIRLLDPPQFLYIIARYHMLLTFFLLFSVFTYPMIRKKIASRRVKVLQ